MPRRLGRYVTASSSTDCRVYLEGNATSHVVSARAEDAS